MNRVTIGLVFAAIACTGQPVIESAENAAGFMKAGLPNSGLAQGSLVVIKGRNLGQRNLAQGGVPLPLELAGTSAQITVGSATMTMPVNYVLGTGDDRTQMSVVVPSGTPVGLGSIRVTYQGKGSAAFPVTVVRAAFGVFTINSAGSGAAVAFTGTTLNTPTDSLAPGGVAQIFGTGLGAVPYSDRLPAAAGNLSTEVEVWVGFKKAKVHYQGRVPEIPSIDQINFTVPSDTPPGCAVSLLVRAGGIVSNATTLPVAPSGGNCSDPLGLPTELFGRTAKGVQVGTVNLIKTAASTGGSGTASIGLRTDLLTASFLRFDYSQLLSYPGNGPSVGSCNVYSFAGRTPAFDAREAAIGLDAGATLLASGPTGSVTLERQPQEKGVYRRMIGGSGPNNGTDPVSQEFLTAGRFTVSGPGGNDLAPFSTSMMWPTGFSWTNQAEFSTVPRSKDLIVRWEGTPVDGYVTVSGYSIGGSVAAPVGASFSCLANGASGSFAVPAIVLQALPATAVPGESAPNAQLTVSASGTPVAFTTSGLDYGSLNYTSAIARTVTFQ